MSEAIISRRGYGIEGKPELRTEMITGNTNWTVPNYKKGNISVRIFGGGAGNRGGSGWMNNGEFNNLTPGTNIRITVGIGGNWDNMVGGTTSFGTYLSANGGSYTGGAGGIGSKGYQFGGGGGYNDDDGGDGGMYGGGGGGGWNGGNIYVSKTTNAGNGGMYGGGGGAAGSDLTRASHYQNGGNGGTYGGGGGGSFGMYDAWRYPYQIREGNGGIGGEYGGNGGDINKAGTNGTNTMNIAEVPAELKGNGISGYYYGSTEKNFYINIYNTLYSNWKINVRINADGGGGYGGRGGRIYQSSQVVETDGGNNRGYVIAGAGGGGYGGNGGDAYGAFDNSGSTMTICGAGGGGYGGRGEDASNNHGGGGGGYFSNGDGGGGGGWYNYCHGGGFWSNGKYGYGSGSASGENGIQGACIIQYWI